jgi:magnesium-transporting ATPase (P-type)
VIKVTSCDPDNPKKSGLGDDILVTIDNPELFFEDAKAPNTRIVLFVNNKPVRDILYEQTADGYRFFMPNEGDVTKLWDYLMNSRGKGEFFLKNVSISLGIENLDTLIASSLDPIPTKIDGKPNRTYTLILVHKTWFGVCLVFLLGIIIFFIVVAKRTDMLRDTGPPPATGRKPFSLARVQMSIWFLVIISSWLLLYVCLHHFDLITENLLILMGITAGTGVGGLALDTNKGHKLTTPSEGFFKDLISDHSNISLFRFQNLAWTMVLVIVFIRTVVVYLRMPEFDMTLLVLMGISSGTYLGAKVTEKRVAENAENAAPADQPADQNP